MQILIERVENRFRASAQKPLYESVEAATREEALERLKDTLTQRMQNTAEWVELQVPGEERFQEDPWAKVVGVFKDDPYFDEWQEAIKENRREQDAKDGPW